MEEAEGGEGRSASEYSPSSSPSRAPGLGCQWFLRLLLVAGWWIPLVLGATDGGGGRGPGRSLLGFRETQGNGSFHCAPSGPCLPCQYSEKNDDKYRCSETGYRIPLKCVEIKDEAKEASGKRSLRSLFSINESQGRQRSYITYRSCLPAEAEEKLSVIGFEMIMGGLLLVSGAIVYIRQRRNIPFPGIGAVRIPTGSSRL